MMTNADCTLFKYDKNTTGFTRHKIKSIYWQTSQQANIMKSGLTSCDSTTVFIYKSSIKGNNIPETPKKDMLVKGIVEFEFDNTSSRTISDSMKAFREMFPRFVTVNSIDNMLYGGLPHIEVSAK